MLHKLWEKAKDYLFEDVGETFIRACSTSDLVLIKRCLAVKVNPNYRSLDSLTGLHVAVIHNYYTIVQFLIKIPNIDINIKDFEGCTPLNMACVRGYYDIVQLLVKNNANVNITEKFGYSPLHNAVRFKHCAVVKFLLNYVKAENLNSANVFGQTPLHAAVIDNPCEDNVKRLVNYGANINATNGIAIPLLIDVALNCQSRSQLKMIELLLQLGANVSIQDHAGRSTLHIVAITGFLPLGTLLLRYNASLDIVDCRGRNPIDLARLLENEPVAALFQFSLKQ